MNRKMKFNKIFVLFFVFSIIVMTFVLSTLFVKLVDKTEKIEIIKTDMPYVEVLANEIDFSNIDTRVEVKKENVIYQEEIVPIYTENVIEVEKEPLSMTYIGDFKLTSYCPCSQCCGQWGGSPNGKTTAIEVGAYEGITFAVDPTVIPYGTKIYIEGVGVGIATDCGGSIKQNRIDVYCTSHERALEFGTAGGYAHAVYTINE